MGWDGPSHLEKGMNRTHQIIERCNKTVTQGCEIVVGEITD